MKLPEIYKNKIDENIRNSQNTFTSKINNNHDPLKDLPATVKIEMKDKEFITTIVAKTDHHLITKNRDVISIKDIIKIKEA